MTAGCEGEAKAQVSPGSSYNVHCTQGTLEILFTGQAGSSSYPPGNYTVNASFDNGHGVRSSESSTFTVVKSQPSGALSPGLVSIVVLAPLTRQRRAPYSEHDARNPGR